MSAERVLMVATIAATIGSFNMDNLRLLQQAGYEVDVAADLTDTSVWTAERLQQFQEQMAAMHITCIQLDFSRRFLDLPCHIRSYKEAVRLLREKRYAFIHTHTPIASAIMRAAAHKTHTKVIYTAHGFHFYTGAPLRNWMMFYPAEKFLSKWTDALITITREDYERAKKRFAAHNVYYIPGVGVDTEKFRPRPDSRERIRAELGLADDQTMLLSVGELNENKNHATVIRAIQGMDLTYVIVGKGDLKEKLAAVAAECGVDLRLMGYRADVTGFYSAADLYVLPSKREGLNVSLMEAMSSGLPCAVSRIRGNTDLIDEEKGGYYFAPTSVEEAKTAIDRLRHKSNGFGAYNQIKVQEFDRKVVIAKAKQIYDGIEG